MVATVTTSNGRAFTTQVLFDAMRHLRNLPPPPVSVVMSPQMVERFAEAIDQSLYGTVNVFCDPTIPPGEAYLVQSPNPE